MFAFIQRIKAVFQQYPQIKWLLLPIVCGLLLRLTGLFLAFHRVGLEGLIYGDGQGYVELARNLIEGHGFTTWYAGEGFIPEQFRTPGLPLLLISGFLIGMKAYLVIQALAAGILIPWLLWRIGRDLFGNKAGLIAAWLGAVEPLMIFFSWFTLTEIPFTIFALAALERSIAACKRSSIKIAIVSGLFAGYAALIRPGNLGFFILGYGIAALWCLYKKQPEKKALLVSLLTLVAVITPWVIRNGIVTNQYTFTASGWRNVYTDYTASILSIEHHSTFWDEKKLLKDQLMQELGIEKSGLNDAGNNDEFKRRSLAVIFSHPWTTIRLQSLLFVSYFSNDSYHLYLQRVGFLPKRASHLSSTASLLNDGVGSLGNIWQEMKSEYFLPILGRLLQVILLAAAAWGFFKQKKPIRWLFAFIILFGFVSSSVIGLGIEGRLRLSVAPLLFLFAGVGLATLFTPRSEYEYPGPVSPGV